MEAPDLEYRRYVAEQAIHAAESRDEEAMEGLLAQVEDRALSEAAGADDRNQGAHELLAAVEAWAGLGSYVVARFYAPHSPWKDDFGGWSQKAVERLRNLANGLRGKLEQVARMIGVTSCSIAVNFPWGISIGLGWTI